MNYPLACADFAFPLLSHEQSLDLISMLGFEGVDIGLFEGRSHSHSGRDALLPLLRIHRHRICMDRLAAL